MDKIWRNGSKQFVDFAMTLTDPTADLTLAEVESMSLKVLIRPGPDTPTRDDPAWIDPSVPRDVEAVGASFKVEILHMYTATVAGFHSVFVKFGPTPEEPIYLAASFTVL